MNGHENEERLGTAILWSERCSPELRFGYSDVGLVPVGAVEQHGPHLPSGTDTIVAEGLCQAAASHSEAIVLPTIPVGCSYGHGTLLPGTLSLSPELLAAVVRQYAVWAVTSGLTRLLFVNAHLGNSSALGIATDHLRLYRPDLQVGVIDWWQATPQLWAEASADGHDIHANRAETSLMLILAPGLVRWDRARDADDVDRTPGLAFRYTAPALSRNGVTGRPSQATDELGQKLFDMAISAIVERIECAKREEPPLGPASQPTSLFVSPPASGAPGSSRSVGFLPPE